MSAERPAIPRPRGTEAATSHLRPAEPFPVADDFEPEAQRDTEPSLPPVTLQSLRRDMISGFAGIHHEINDEKTGLRPAVNALASRVVKLEADAAWKAWAIRVGKAAIPIVAYLLGEHFPGLSKFLPALLNAAGGGP